MVMISSFLRKKELKNEVEKEKNTLRYKLSNTHKILVLKSNEIFLRKQYSFVNLFAEFFIQSFGKFFYYKYRLVYL